MNDVGKIRYSPILNHRYEQFFRDVQYNGKKLNASERKKYIAVVDETISDFSNGLPLMKNTLESITDKHDEFHDIQRTIVTVMLFVLITMIDSMVLGKYFILANKDYDKRLMRGKMMVILNEGFKRLYGFDTKTRKNSEWNSIIPILSFFPENIKLQYNHLTSLLENHSKSSSWWREERNVETHLDAEKLYASRCEDIEESKVMIESLKLFDTLYAVNLFLNNMHACLYNLLVDKHMRGELKEE